MTRKKKSKTPSRHCPRCDGRASQAARFCPRCGAALEEGAVRGEIVESPRARVEALVHQARGRLEELTGDDLELREREILRRHHEALARRPDPHDSPASYGYPEPEERGLIASPTISPTIAAQHSTIGGVAMHSPFHNFKFQRPAGPGEVSDHNPKIVVQSQPGALCPAGAGCDKCDAERRSR